MAFQSSVTSSIPRLPVSFSPDGVISGGPQVRGDSTPWLRFSWQTARLTPAAGSDLIRPATREEGEDVLKVILLSLSMDAAWNGSYAQAEEYLKGAIGRLFNAEEPLCLVIPKGNRLVAASLLDPNQEAAGHLVSGPSVLMEYRNRGLGSQLLHASLAVLHEKGFAEVTGITRTKSVAALHVYPKFGSTSKPVLFSTLDEGSRESKS
ncbi:MAG: GNAT family N-acetyltransferase [bacterium]